MIKKKLFKVIMNSKLNSLQKEEIIKNIREYKSSDKEEKQDHDLTKIDDRNLPDYTIKYIQKKLS